MTQADLDAGRVTDTATATAVDTAGLTSPTSAPSTATTLTAPAAPAVTLAKTAAVSPAADQKAARVGDTIAYTFEVTNTGNVTLTTVAVSDPTGGEVTCPTPRAPGLAPGRAMTCTGDTPHLVTQADLAAGQVVDTATANGTDTQGQGSPPSTPSTATVPVEASPTSQPGRPLLRPTPRRRLRTCHQHQTHRPPLTASQLPGRATPAPPIPLRTRQPRRPSCPTDSDRSAPTSDGGCQDTTVSDSWPEVSV